MDNARAERDAGSVLALAIRVIGYQPEDDSEERFAEDIARMLRS